MFEKSLQLLQCQSQVVVIRKLAGQQTEEGEQLNNSENDS